jgi:hypothetical protein
MLSLKSNMVMDIHRHGHGHGHRNGHGLGQGYGHDTGTGTAEDMEMDLLVLPTTPFLRFGFPLLDIIKKVNPISDTDIMSSLVRHWSFLCIS